MNVLDMDAIARAISDPGSVTPRVRDDAHQYLESVPRWAARAVTLVLADREADLRAQIESLRESWLAWSTDSTWHASAFVGQLEALLSPADPPPACRAGCPTQDHASWGDCARDARIGIDREALRP